MYKTECRSPHRVIQYILIILLTAAFFSCLTPPPGKPEPAKTEKKEKLSPGVQSWFDGKMAENIGKVFPAPKQKGKNLSQIAEEEALSAEAQRLLDAYLAAAPETAFKSRLNVPPVMTVSVIETDEINSFAAGDGTVIVTRGLLACASARGQKAAILAHEIAHLSLGHPLAPVNQSRLEALSGGRAPAPQELDAAISGTGSTRQQIMQMLYDSLFLVMDSGYGSKAEFAADEETAVILSAGGFSALDMQKLLAKMETRLDPDRPDIAATHPAPAERIAHLSR